MYNNMEWLVHSDIRIKNGKDRGALYGWKNLSSKSFPFIYSEITGYAITSFSWMVSEFGNLYALEAAKAASAWIVKKMDSKLLPARPAAEVNCPNDLSNMYYSFDNGMVAIGLLNLYKITNDRNHLELAQSVTDALIERFFDGEKLIARLDNSFNSIKSDDDKGLVKWSTVPGAHHCKISLVLLELSRLTDNGKYAQIANSLCNYARKLQNPSGLFVTNPGSDIVHLHPHLYACEGLIYSGIKQSDEGHFTMGVKGIKWAMEHISSSNGGLFRNTEKESVEQSDCTAQLLRLLLLCRSRLTNYVKYSHLRNIIDRLHLRLLDFYIPDGEGCGAMKYQQALETACSWCTMFSAQALNLWEKESPPQWIDFFV